MLNSLPNDYRSSLEKVLEWRAVKPKQLSKIIHVNERTINRIIKGDTKGSINTLLLICLGLHLPPEISFYIIGKSPYSFDSRNGNHIWYKFILTHLYGHSMYEIREFINSHGLDTL